MWELYHIDVLSRHIVILSSPGWELENAVIGREAPYGRFCIMADDVIREGACHVIESSNSVFSPLK